MKVIEVLFTIVAIAMAVFHIYTASFGVLTAMFQRSIHLGFAITVAYLLIIWNVKSLFDKISGALACGLGLSSLIYLGVNYYEIVERFGFPNPYDLFFGVVIIFVVLDMTRRVMGWTLPIIGILFLIYAFAGPYMPGLLHHRGYDLSRVIDSLYLSTEGIFGIPLAVSANFIFLFIIMGTFLGSSGAGDFYINLANAGFGRARGGPAKAAVFSSALFGSISGSAVGNVVTTGTITIPMMKRLGYKPEFAGAVEAVASTGGQIMPPIMGAAAFVMAEMLNLPYYVIVKAAFIPAVIYFVSVFMSVHFEAVKTGIEGMDKGSLPNLSRTLVRQWYYLLPLVLLIYLLVIVKWTPMKVGVYTIGSILIVGFYGKGRQFGFKAIIKSLETSARTALVVVGSCATAGIVIGVINLTGLGLRFSSVVLSAAGGHLILMLILVMISCIILGMGLSTTPAYLILAVLAAPALIKLNVTEIAAHLFIFYFGCLSLITPPIATASYAAAGIAKVNPLKVSLIASRLALPAFIVPYFFLYNPSLLAQGELLTIMITFLTGIAGAIAISGAIIGCFFIPANFLERLVLFGSALCLIDAKSMTNYLGLAGLLIVIGWQLAKKRHKQAFQ